MENKVILNGITWDHSRGYCPMVATGQRFSELKQNAEILWSKRSLQGFANDHIQELAARFDLLVIDHPWAGYAAQNNVILPLENLMPESFLQDQKLNSVGKSFESYSFNGSQYALPIDAAAPVACYRADLFESSSYKIPTNFNDLLDLASNGHVTMPGIPIDTLMNFYMMCIANGEIPAISESYLINEKVGLLALEMLKELTDRLNPEFFDWNPIKVCEMMTLRDDLLYCPWLYGYVNYSKKGYARRQLDFQDVISDLDGNPFVTTLGGTGLAISANCKNIDLAVEYVMMVAAEETQKSLYFDNGGQPGHKKAWIDSKVNMLSSNFFSNTISSLSNSFLRPRYNGYMYFQDHAGDPIRDYLKSGGQARNVINRINELYLESRKSIAK